VRSWWPVRLLGLDIGSAAIKAAWVKLGLGGIKLLRSDQTRIEADGAGQALGRLLKSGRHSDLIAAGLGGHKAYFRIIDLPRLSGARLRQAAAFELENHLPVTGDSLAVDLINLEGRRADGLKGLAFGLSRQRLEASLAELGPARIKPHVVSLDTIGLIAAARLAKADSGLILDLGAAKTTMLRLKDGRPLDLGFSSLAGWALDRHLARSNGWSMDKARQFKEDLSRPEETLTRLGPPLEELAREISLFLKAASLDEEDFPERIYLCGGTSRLPGLGDFLARTLDLEVRWLKPLDQPVAPELVPALGLAVSEVDFNLARGDRRVARTSGDLKLVALGLGLIAVLAGANLYLRLHQAFQAREAIIEAKVALLRQNLPHLGRVVSPLAQMETELSKAKEEVSALTRGRTEGLVLETLLTLNRLAQGKGVTLDEIVFDGPNLIVAGLAEGFDKLEEFQAALNQEPGFSEVTLETSRREGSGQGVRFRLRIKR